MNHLGQHLPTSAYPSRHEAATCYLYMALAILVIGHAHGWCRWLFLIPAAAMPVLVAISRMYRGEYHPTDILGSLPVSVLWLTAATVLIRPNARHTGGRPRASRPGSSPRRVRSADLEYRTTGEPLLDDVAITPDVRQ